MSAREEWLRALDALVEEHVFGHDIVGQAGAWGECEYDNASPEPGPHPVYVRECICERVREMHEATVARCVAEYGWSEDRVFRANDDHAAEWIHGHNWQCLGVARSYSRSISDAWKLLHVFIEAGGSAWIEGDGHTGYVAGCTTARNGEVERVEVRRQDSPTIAAVLASLRAVGAAVPKEPDDA